MTLSTAQNEVEQQPAKSIHASVLMSLLDHYANSIQILSLDCFDTLLWRNTAEPRDVFLDLMQKPCFQSLEYSARTRIEAEINAYQLNRVKHGKTQATLHEIYQGISPHLSEETITALMEEEIQSEMNACYVFPPVIELIRAAHNKGLKIIIVSDTYLVKCQLKRLLESKLSSDIMATISEIFCSCDYGQSKVEGIFQHVVNSMHVHPKAILHLGDNFAADYDAACRYGLHGVHLVHHYDTLHETMRMQTIAASLIDPSIRTHRSLVNPFRGLLAQGLLTNTPENIIGYATLGPILFSFAQYLSNEINQIKATGKNPKVLFLMRDAYLPSLVCEEFLGQPLGHRVRISRFSAFAASFRNEKDIERYLAANVKSLRFRDMCTQLLLPEELTDKILKKIEHSPQPVLEFSRLIQEKNTLQLIYNESSAYRKRLQKYLENTIQLQPGDTLLFVDLGYTCSTQIQLEQVFKEEFGVEIVGRYVIAVRTPGWKKTRRGLLDAVNYDDKALGSLIYYIPIFEKLCCSNDKCGSDYDENGNIIFSDMDVSQDQHQKLNLIQAECLRFVKEAKCFFNTTDMKFTEQMLRDTVAINLTRLTYFPTQMEINFLKIFNCEINLGTKEVLPLFDLNKGITSLRHRTWLYANRENVKNMRLTYPVEWRSANLELSMAMLALHRYEFQIALTDLSHRRESLQIIFTLPENNTSRINIEAIPTHDGYYAAMIPITPQTQLGICFGLNYHWVELDAAELIKISHLFSPREYENTCDASANLVVSQMADKGGGLFECLTDAGFLMFIPPNNLENENYTLRLTFRPIVKRVVVDSN